VANLHAIALSIVGVRECQIPAYDGGVILLDAQGGAMGCFGIMLNRNGECRYLIPLIAARLNHLIVVFLPMD